MLVSSVSSASVIRDRLVGGDAKKLSSVLGRFAAVMSGAIVYARVRGCKQLINRMFSGEVMLEQNRILLTRCSLNTSIVIYCAEDAIKRSMTSSCCRDCDLEATGVKCVTQPAAILFVPAVLDHHGAHQAVVSRPTRSQAVGLPLRGPKAERVSLFISHAGIAGCKGDYVLLNKSTIQPNSSARSMSHA